MRDLLAERLAGAMRGELWRTDTQTPMPVQSAWAAPSAQDLEPYIGSYRFRRGSGAVKSGESGVIIETPSRYDAHAAHRAGSLRLHERWAGN